MRVAKHTEMSTARTHQVNDLGQIRLGDTYKMLDLWLLTRHPLEMPPGAGQAVRRLDPIVLSQLEGPDPKYGIDFVKINQQPHIFGEPGSEVRVLNLSEHPDGGLLTSKHAFTSKIPESGLLSVGGMMGDVFAAALVQDNGDLGVQMISSRAKEA